MPATTLESQLRRVHERIARAARAAGRDPVDVRLLPVTKSVPAEVALALARLGERELGESRLEALEPKAARCSEAGLEVRWHFIGHVQRNKARRVVKLAHAIHSVDSLRLVETLARIAREEGRRPEIHLEVKLSHEEAKHGFAPAELDDALRAAGAAPELALVGLMTMAPLADDPARPAARAVFEELAAIAARIEADPERARHFEGGRVLLSMGMSADYETAIAAGSHLVRVGSALFEDVEAQRSEPGGEVRR